MFHDYTLFVRADTTALKPRPFGVLRAFIVIAKHILIVIRFEGSALLRLY